MTHATIYHDHSKHLTDRWVNVVPDNQSVLSLALPKVRFMFIALLQNLYWTSPFLFVLKLSLHAEMETQ